VPDYSASAVFTGRRKFVNGALKAIEHMPVACRDDLECLVVVVSAYFALCHWSLLLSKISRHTEIEASLKPETSTGLARRFATDKLSALARPLQ
jgi:hypothetical protein